MCQFASFVLTKDKVFWNYDNDSHSDIIQRYELHEYGARGPNILKVEIVPPGQNFPPAKWAYRIDQDELPEWHEPIADEKRARAALAIRLEKTLFVDSAATTAASDVAEYVYASGCAALTSLEAPKATYVDASGCAALTSLEAPEATYVDASGCAALTKTKKHWYK